VEDMALGILRILFWVLALSVVVAQFLLYKTTNNNGAFIFNVILGIILSFLIFTSLPENFIAQKYTSLIWGALAIIGIVCKTMNIKNITISKIILTVSVVGGLIQLFI
jgi:multisubunit Na+/H+ antiporter MnhE subunit